MVNNNIPIRNIYYMLCYAWGIIDYSDDSLFDSEGFDNIYNLLATILYKEVSNLIRRGFTRGYIEITESTSKLKGQINITESINQRTQYKKQMVCTYDDYSPDILFNQIIKSTLVDIIKYDKLNKDLKTKIRKLIPMFVDVDYVEINKSHFNRLRFNRNNINYQMIINVCRLFHLNLISSMGNGNIKFADYLDNDQMAKLYEKFILEFYRKEVPSLSVTASKIDWQLDDDLDEYLPEMQSDIMLQNDNKILIIDAKFYRRTMQIQFDKKTYHSSNMYQIFTYVKNKTYEDKSKEVSGMLLYAKTDEDVTPNSDYVMSGNKISVKALDLNQNFEVIKEQLFDIVSNYF